MKKICQGAIEGYLDTGLRCNYSNSVSAVRCVNTKEGHAKGHQAEDGSLLEAGDFQRGSFDFTEFQNQVTIHIANFLQELNKLESNQRRKVAHAQHRSTLQSSMAWIKTSESISTSTKTCFGCLLTAPGYGLPCGHMLCELCIKNFDQSDENEAYPSLFAHHDCLLCSQNSSPKWPIKFRILPPLSGLRILSLDGGGVRGIVELVTLERLESAIRLGLPISAYFDLIVGTSAGR